MEILPNPPCCLCPYKFWEEISWIVKWWIYHFQFHTSFWIFSFFPCITRTLDDNSFQCKPGNYKSKREQELPVQLLNYIPHLTSPDGRSDSQTSYWQWKKVRCDSTGEKIVIVVLLDLMKLVFWLYKTFFIMSGIVYSIISMSLFPQALL